MRLPMRDRGRSIHSADAVKLCPFDNRRSAQSLPTPPRCRRLSGKQPAKETIKIGRFSAVDRVPTGVTDKPSHRPASEVPKIGSGL